MTTYMTFFDEIAILSKLGYLISIFVFSVKFGAYRLSLRPNWIGI